MIFDDGIISTWGNIYAALRCLMLEIERADLGLTQGACTHNQTVVAFQGDGDRMREVSTEVCVCVAQSCLTLCDRMDCSLPASSVHGSLQARILEWVAISVSRRSSQPRDRTQVSHIAGRFFIVSATREDLYISNVTINKNTKECI